VGVNKTMIYGIFKEKLHKLNPRLKVFENCEPEKNPWGLYLVSPFGTEIKHICGVSVRNGFIYELTERRWDGYILRQGWRRILKILLTKKLIDKKKAESLFSTSFDGNRGKGLVIKKDPLTLAMEDARQRGQEKSGIEGYVQVDDLVDIHRWREKLRKDKTNYWA
jgi:hypothetical protein